MQLTLPFCLKLACTSVLWHNCGLGSPASMVSAGGKAGADQAPLRHLEARLALTACSAALLGLATA